MSKELQPTNFTEGKILGPLLRFVLPVLAALFLLAMYGAVDLFVVRMHTGVPRGTDMPQLPGMG
jgi:hypothetical protein